MVAAAVASSSSLVLVVIVVVAIAGVVVVAGVWCCEWLCHLIMLSTVVASAAAVEWKDVIEVGDHVLDN